MNEKQLNNLKIFLGRVPLKGLEVEAFNELIGILFKENLPTNVCEAQKLQSVEEIKTDNKATNEHN